jgi:hypothetical protein
MASALLLCTPTSILPIKTSGQPPRQPPAARLHSSNGRRSDEQRHQGRPVELIIADYESKPEIGRRKAEKLVVEDLIDAQVGGYLSNVCLACIPVYGSTRSST